MVLVAPSAARGRSRKLHQQVALAALTPTFVACSVYDFSLLDEARTGGEAREVGGSPANTGGRTSATWGRGKGTSGEGNVCCGKGRAGNEGGMGATVSDTGGVEGTGGSVGTSAGGEATRSSGGTANDGGSGSGGAALGGSATGGGAGGSLGGGKTDSGGSDNGGSAGATGAVEACSGCARLSVPLRTADDRARFPISLPAESDLSSTSITFRIAKLKGTGGRLRGYIQEGDPSFATRFGAPIEIASIGTSMQDIVWNVADMPGGADTTAIQRIGIEISGAGSIRFSNPTVIYLDRVDAAIRSWTFDTAASVYSAPTLSGRVDEIWLNSYTVDTNVLGASVSWVGP